MKKLILIIAACVLSCNSMMAQVITTEEIELAFVETFGDIPIDGKDWMMLADSIKDSYPLDVNNQISITNIIEVPNKSKSDLFIAAHSWLNASFNDGKSVVQMADKDAGVILAKGFLSGVGHRDGFSKSVTVSASVIIRLDIKDSKMRLITTIQKYEMAQTTGVGSAVLGALSGSRVDNSVSKFSILPNEGYPFEIKKNKNYKRETSIGYASSIAYSLLLKQKLELAVTLGITGTDGDDW
ncbi:MAG: DUF4468 domain-containing protein [Alistipes sp.]|nr:DUF4468 domain-containing protein [Alistipes sp.]